MAAVLFFVTVFPTIAQEQPSEPPQSLDFERIQADSAFRDGVLFLHAGRTNEAVVAFQRALSFKPDDVLARYWLGRAYYFGGYDEAAAEEWRQVSDGGGGTPALQSFQETLIARRGFGDEMRIDVDFFPAAAYRLTVPGSTADIRFGADLQASERTASHPMPGLIAVRPDGWVFAANFSRNAVQVYDANGRLRSSYTGGIGGFSGPFGIVLLPENRIAVTSLRSDFVHIVDATDGTILLTFGGAGIGPGQFIGPQHIAYDPDGYLYIVDYGNQRIQKWTEQGEFLFAFGDETVFNRPMGVLYRDGVLYVLDRDESGGMILSFDGFGNPMGEFRNELLTDGENLAEGILNRHSEERNSSLLVTCRTGLYIYYPDNGTLEAIYSALADENRGFVDAKFDTNGNILTSDALNREIVVLSRLSGLYSGIHVQIDHIDADSFPKVRAEITVEDRAGHPVLGLDIENFSLTQERIPVSSPEVIQHGYRLDTVASQILLVPESGLRRPEYRTGSADAIASLWTAMEESDSAEVIVSGSVPQIVYDMRGSAETARSIVDNLTVDPLWALDLGIRLAGNRLIRQNAIRQIYVIGDGGVSPSSFERFGLEETRAFMYNNGIKFSFIAVGFDSIDPVYEYLADSTGGRVLRYFETEDFLSIVEDTRTGYPGRYILEFTSEFDADFGRRYLPIEVEVRHLSKSGRDEAGFFAPLEF